MFASSASLARKPAGRLIYKDVVRTNANIQDSTGFVLSHQVYGGLIFVSGKKFLLVLWTSR